MNVSSPDNLKKVGIVDVVILGAELPIDLIGFVQEYKIAGFISPEELTEASIIKMLLDIEDHGYFANQHIPANYWINKLPYKFPRRKPVLTPLEEQVLKLLCHNLTVKEISVALGKNEPAIRAHISNLREKLFAKSLLEIVVIAMANMWVKIDPKLTSSSSPFL
jgi:DNA-binding CsgD family transcriptional regulator